MTVELINPVLNEANKDSARSRVSLGPSFGTGGAALVALCAHIQELGAKNEESVAPRAGS